MRAVVLSRIEACVTARSSIMSKPPSSLSGRQLTAFTDSKCADAAKLAYRRGPKPSDPCPQSVEWWCVSPLHAGARGGRGGSWGTSSASQCVVCMRAEADAPFH